MLSHIFSPNEQCGGGGGGGGYAARLFLLFSFPCSADHERDWPPCKVVFFGLATNTLNVRNKCSDFSLNNNKVLLRGSMNLFLHLLSRMYSSSTFYAQNPALEQKSLNVLSTHTCNMRMFSRRTLLCAASCVTKNISPRFSRTIFYRDANSVILRAHLCTAVASMRKLCPKSFTRSRLFMLSL